jgi:hypothetical protein
MVAWYGRQARAVLKAAVQDVDGSESRDVVGVAAVFAPGALFLGVGGGLGKGAGLPDAPGLGLEAAVAGDRAPGGCNGVIDGQQCDQAASALEFWLGHYP